jgi:hypothetical protein
MPKPTKESVEQLEKLLRNAWTPYGKDENDAFDRIGLELDRLQGRVPHD